MRGGDHNVKYPDLIHWYRSYDGEKCKYIVFMSRVIRYWYSKEEAITPQSLHWKHFIKTEIRENGRECTACGKFKFRDEFHKTKGTTTGRTSNCKACRNLAKQKARAEGRTNDREYKLRTRKLEIWSYIAFLTPIYVDWAPRENVREVVGYQFKKDYQLKSVHTGTYRTLDTNDNRKVSQNCLPYYRVDAPIQLGDNSKPTLLMPTRDYIHK